MADGRIGRQAGDFFPISKGKYGIFYTNRSLRNKGIIHHKGFTGYISKLPQSREIYGGMLQWRVFGREERIDIKGRYFSLIGQKYYIKRYTNICWCIHIWARLNIKTVFPVYRDSHVKDKTVSRDRLIFNMRIPTLVRQHLYTEAPRPTQPPTPPPCCPLWRHCFMRSAHICLHNNWGMLMALLNRPSFDILLLATEIRNVVTFYSCHSEFKTMRPEQNGRPFADDNFNTFSQWTSSNLNKIWFKCVPVGPIDNKSALVQVMDWAPNLRPAIIIWRHYAIIRWENSRCACIQWCPM